MAAWATTTDLKTYAPDVTDYGTTDWTPEITLAQNAVLEWLKGSWWPKQVTRWPGYRGPSSIWPMDEALINTALMKPAVCFRALGWEILPKLAKWSDVDGDTFLRRAEWFRQRYHEELERIEKMDLYDWNRDGNWTDYERSGPTPQAVIRRA